MNIRERALLIAYTWQTQKLSELMLRKTEVDALVDLIAAGLEEQARQAIVSQLMGGLVFVEGQEFKFKIKRVGENLQVEAL